MANVCVEALPVDCCDQLSPSQLILGSELARDARQIIERIVPIFLSLPNDPFGERLEVVVACGATHVLPQPRFV